MMECKNFPNCDTDFSRRIATLEVELAEAKRVTFDPKVLEQMNALETENAVFRKALEDIVEPPPEPTLGGLTRLRGIARAALNMEK